MEFRINLSAGSIIPYSKQRLITVNISETPQKMIEDEISLFDIFNFLQENWKTIAGVGLAGAVGASAYLAITPPQFESKVQIEMAQVHNSGSGSGSGSKNANTLGINIEAPEMLVERLKQPTTYTQEVIQACGVQDQMRPSEEMASLINASVPQKLSTVVEITIRRGTPELAMQCATAVFKMVHAQQAALYKPYLDESQKLLATLQARLKENQDFLAKMNMAGPSQMVYLASRDETLYLMNQINSLEQAISQHTETRLVAPAYASPKAVFPKKTHTLLLGAISGLMFGLFVAMMRKALVKRHTS